MAKAQPEDDALFKYLGFEIHPGKVDEFWKSDDEKKRYLSQVKARGAQLSVLDRETALLNISLMSSTDKLISIIGAGILILSFFLPAYSIDAPGRVIWGSAISYFLNLPFLGSYASWGGAGMILTAVVFGLYLVSCPAAGVLNILGLFNRNKGDRYLITVKKFSRFTFVPIALLAILMVLLLFGGPHPFGSLGVRDLGESLNIVALFTLTGYGFWLSIVGLALGFAQGRGI